MKDRIKNDLKPDYLLNQNKKISKHNQELLRNWAIEANKIDSSRSINFYYKLFAERLKQNFIKRKFFKEGVIEN